MEEVFDPKKRVSFYLALFLIYVDTVKYFTIFAGQNF